MSLLCHKNLSLNFDSCANEAESKRLILRNHFRCQFGRSSENILSVTFCVYRELTGTCHVPLFDR